MRLHKKIHLWWGTWWAVQLVLVADEMSAGVRINIRRPLLDVYLGPLTIAIGRHAVYTDPRTRTWDSCRGMLFPDDPHHPLDAVSARML
jgi:hypothetical protein